MARKIDLKIYCGGGGRLHNKLSGAFSILVKVWHPLEIYVTFLSVQKCWGAIHNPTLFVNLIHLGIHFEGEQHVLLSALGFES